jgi:hypothetical protein
MRTPAKTRNDRKILSLRFGGSGEDRADARRVHRHRLLAKDMLAGFDRRFEMHRTKARRRREQHNINTAIDYLLIGVEPHELVFGRNFDFVAVHLLQGFQAALERVLERVPDRQ